MDAEKKGGSAWLWVVVVVVLALLAYGGYKYYDYSQNGTAALPPASSTPDKVILYKDGEYSAIGDYNSPGGAEQIKVTLTLKDDVITDATVLSLATRPETKVNQAKFISGYKALVIGRKITEVTLSKVSGSSLTSKGWNDAISKIQTQAKA